MSLLTIKSVSSVLKTLVVFSGYPPQYCVGGSAVGRWMGTLTFYPVVVDPLSAQRLRADFTFARLVQRAPIVSIATLDLPVPISMK